MVYTASCPSPLGEITLTSDGTALTGLSLPGQTQSPSVGEKTVQAPGLPVFAATEAWLARYFAGENPGPETLPPLAPAGSPFRRAVWRLLLEIPYGAVLSYGALAKTLARREGKAVIAAQAVGGAVGHNPISILIPCHRVVGADGSLTGYGGGVEKKVALLQIEGITPESLPARVNQKVEENAGQSGTPT